MQSRGPRETTGLAWNLSQSRVDSGGNAKVSAGDRGRTLSQMDDGYRPSPEVVEIVGTVQAFGELCVEHPDLGDLLPSARRAWLTARQLDDNDGMAGAHNRIETAIALAESYRCSSSPWSGGSSRSAASGRTREPPGDQAILTQSARLQGADEEPASGTSSVDQLLEGQTRSRPKVSEMTLDGARPDAHELGGVLGRIRQQLRKRRARPSVAASPLVKAPRRHPSVMPG